MVRLREENLMNHEQIEGFAALLRDVPKLTEIDLRYEGMTLRLRRVTALPPQRPVSTQAVPSVTAEPKGIVLTAQHVGVFLALKENAPQVGDLVKIGQTLGKLDTMRLLSDCQTTVAGRIQAIFVEDGQPVEYGQSLFEIQPEAA